MASPPGARRTCDHQATDESPGQGDEHQQGDRQGPGDPQADGDGAGSPSIDPKQARLSDRVTGQRLHQHPGYPKGRSRDERDQRPGPAHSQHDKAVLTGATTGEHRDHLIGWHRARPEQERCQDQAGQQNRQPKQRPDGPAHWV